MANYKAVDDALTDVLRLSKGMSYKNIMAGIPYGGGKCVIVADPRTQKTPQMLASFARHVQGLGAVGMRPRCPLARCRREARCCRHRPGSR